jgi:hypothetical protein
MEIKIVTGFSEIDILTRAREIAPPKPGDDRSLARRVLEASPEEYERLKAELLRGLR